MLITIDDLRRRARRRLPRAVFDFIDGGAEDELTLRRNESALKQVTLRPRVLVDTHARDQSVTVLGQRVSTPLILAPTGLCGMAAPRGEILSARASLNAGVIFTLSSMSAVTIEDSMAAVPGPHWFQLYVWRDRELTHSLVERAAAAGYRAMVVTVDVPVLGQRERDLRNGATIPPRVTLSNAFDSVQKLGWLLGMARNPRIDFVNVPRPGQGLGPFALGPFVNSQFDPSVSWNDIAWFRSIWPGPLVLKGIMSAEDARTAVDHGVNAI